MLTNPSIAKKFQCIPRENSCSKENDIFDCNKKIYYQKLNMKKQWKNLLVGNWNLLNAIANLWIVFFI